MIPIDFQVSRSKVMLVTNTLCNHKVKNALPQNSLCQLHRSVGHDRCKFWRVPYMWWKNYWKWPMCHKNNWHTLPEASNLVGRKSLMSRWPLSIFRSVDERSRSKVNLFLICWGRGALVFHKHLYLYKPFCIIQFTQFWIRPQTREQIGRK